MNKIADYKHDVQWSTVHHKCRRVAAVVISASGLSAPRTGYSRLRCPGFTGRVREGIEMKVKDKLVIP